MQGYIYKITNKITNKFYIGSTINLTKRQNRHFYDLKLNKHHSIYLQRSYNKHGKEQFIFEVIAIYEVNTTNKLLEVEQEYLDTYKNLYNVSRSASGGDLISYHPNRNDIIARAKISHKKTMESLSSEERKKRYSKPGKLNGMYGKIHTEKAKEKISKAMRGHTPWNKGQTEVYSIKTLKKMTEAAKLRTGEQNHFFGKHHSNEIKKKLSEIGKKRFIDLTPKQRYDIDKNMRLISIDFVTYYGVTDAAKQLKVCPATICYRIKSKNELFKNYKYLD